MTKSLPPKSLVLYADDDMDDIDLVEYAFSPYSHNVQLQTFPNGAELLHFVRQLNKFDPLPCLIILDINMPVMNGKEALKHIRSIEAFKEVPVVLFTTSTLPSEASFARSFDAGFVTKPLHTRQLHVLIEQMTQHCTEEIQRLFKRNKDV